MFKEAVALNPTLASVRIYIATWLVRREQRYVEALEVLEPGLELDPTNVHLLDFLQTIADQVPSKAIRLYEKALEKEPTYTSLWIALVEAYNYCEDYGAVVRACKGAIENNVNTSTIWESLGRAYKKTGFYIGAIEAYEHTAERGQMDLSVGVRNEVGGNLPNYR